MIQGNIQPERIQHLNDLEIRRGDYVLYWMQQSQRTDHNHALEYAVQQANALNAPLLVVFGLMDGYPESNLRHYTFLLEGLQEVWKGLTERGIKFVVRRGEPPDVVLAVGKNASLIVCDRGYLRHQKSWRSRVAGQANCRVVQVESDVVVPVEVVTSKAEYAARSIRSKLHKHLDKYLEELTTLSVNKRADDLPVEGIDLHRAEELLQDLPLDRTVASVSTRFRGGTTAASQLFQVFLDKKLSHYTASRNQPQTDDVSYMSMYLHFGHISPVYLALQINAAESCPENDRESFLDELIVRRELAVNFVHYTHNYDSIACLPDWAGRTLKAHSEDRREHLYSREQMEDAQTHDEYWNAAMKEMRVTGYMHNYMRMYWGKKILEWSATSEEAYATALALNNKYFIDGRDPNSYANVAWIFGLHDRPWRERSVFGKIRYMSASGLERKCDIGAYLQKVESLVRE
jgi:deoxyribodipyrimidine photo-lyase